MAQAPDSSSSAGHPRRFFQRLLETYARGGTVLLGVLAALLVGCAAYTIEAEKPWGKTVQKRLDRGQDLKPEEHAIIGLWWAALANCGLLGIMLGTARWWMPRPQSGSHPRAGAKASSPTLDPARVKTAPRWLLVALTVGAVAAGLWERAPRMTHSLWNDELFAMRRFVYGAWEQKKDGAWQFEKAPWSDTFFENSNGNNHLLDSLMMRVSHTIWQAATQAPPDGFSEVALRLPSLLAGLGTLVLLPVLGRQLGSPLIGIAAAWLLVFSSWHIRFSTDAKGYAELLFFITLHLIGLSNALKTNKLRWWLLFGLAQAGYILCFAGSVYIAMAVNSVAGLTLLLKREWKPLWSLCAFNLLGAILVIQWMAPSAPQMQAYLNSPDALRLGMDWVWVRDVFLGLHIGAPHDNPLPQEHLGASWQQLLEDASPAWRGFILIFSQGVLPLLILVGIVAVFRQRRLIPHLILSALLLAAVVSFMDNYLRDHPMVVWYMVFLVIPLSLLLPYGIYALLQSKPVLCGVALVALIISYAVVVHGPITAIQQHDRQPVRQTVAHIRGEAPNALTGVFGVSDRQVRVYDPRVSVLENPAQLESLIAQARKDALPLYVYACGEVVSGQRRPEILQRVKNAEEFQYVRSFPGTEELFSYKLYRLK